MPNYEYSCRECGTYGSVYRTYKEDDPGMDCGCVGVKNIAEQKDAPKDNKISRCNSCGAWQFSGLDCHTCLLIDVE